jgi:cob(I)alamin adenosyltransferase
MGILRQVAEYLFIKKKDPNAPKTFNIKAMHFINRLSILLFILAMVILAVKLLR